MSMSVQTQYRQSPFKPAPVFADDSQNITEEGLNQMKAALETAENLNELLSHQNSGSKQAKNFAEYRIQQIPSSVGQSPLQSAATNTGSPLKSGAFAKSPVVSVSIFNPLEHLDSSDEDECTFHPKINNKPGFLARRTISVGDTNEVLYKDAADRTLKNIEYQQLEEILRGKAASASKIGTKSTKIVLKKLQQSLSQLIKDSEDEGTPDNLSFEGVGTVFNRLGVFQNLEFTSGDNDGEKSVLSINHVTVKPERLAREIHFHENIWKILALASIEVNRVPSDLVLRFIMTLVEDKTAQAEAATFLLEILDAKLVSLGLVNEHEKFMYHKLREEKKVWSLEKVVTEFRKLFEDKTSFMNTYAAGGVIKPKLIEAYKQYPHPHTPKTLKKSATLDNKHLTTKLTKKFSVAESDIKHHKLDQRHHRLYKYHNYIKDKKSVKLEEKINEELAPCTFSPQIKNYKNFKTQNTLETSSFSPNKSGYFTQAMSPISPPNRHLLLYEVARTYKEKLQQKAYSLKKKDEIEDMSLCTFQPKLNDEVKSANIRCSDFYEGVPNGFKKNVERLHKGEDLRQTKKIDEETIPRGENYEKNRAAEFTPPTFITRPKITKKDVLVYVDVSIGPGRTGRIGIHKGDNAKSLALNFARTYSLNATMRDSLQKLLQSYIDSYFAQTTERPAASAEAQGVQNKVEEEDDEEEDDEDEDDEDEDEEDDDEEEGQKQ